MYNDHEVIWAIKIRSYTMYNQHEVIYKCTFLSFLFDDHCSERDEVVCQCTFVFCLSTAPMTIVLYGTITEDNTPLQKQLEVGLKNILLHLAGYVDFISIKQDIEAKENEHK